MKKILLLLAFLGLSTFALAENGKEENDPFNKLDWHMGPATESVGSVAKLKTSRELQFLDQSNSKKFLELTGNLPENGNNILLSEKGNWWAAFSFDESGYVKDDEKIDADDLLKTLKEGDEGGNKERARLGLKSLHTVGWYVPPHYDPQTKQLEWGVQLDSEGKPVLNYTVRLLGRSGVMSATLVSDPEHLDADVKDFKQSLQGFEFNSGSKYSEFKDGDKMAEYGLAALVVGGAAAVATKKGFWAILAKFGVAAGKFIVVGVLGIGAWIASIFKRKD